MRSVLCDGGFLVFDQGQSDAMMADPPRFAPLVNTRDHSRLYTLAYSADTMHVEVFDFTHTAQERSFAHESFDVRIRLADCWIDLVRRAGFSSADLFGDWKSTPYDKETSNRLIAVAWR